MCRTGLAKDDLGNPIVKGLPTQWLRMKKKQIQNAHEVSYAKTKFPTKNPIFEVAVCEICMLCIFRCADKI